MKQRSGEGCGRAGGVRQDLRGRTIAGALATSLDQDSLPAAPASTRTLGALAHARSGSKYRS